VSAALQIWSPTFCKAFDALPNATQQAIQIKVDDMGTRLASFPHRRLTGRAEHRLRVGDYRVLYEFDMQAGRVTEGNVPRFGEARSGRNGSSR
jgi:mRNA-degrading endonuclease RelE of RelBE toxin-antitoxin system